MKKGFLFLNGNPPSSKILKTLDYSNAFIVCADGAYNYLKDYCVPNILVGDFDSLDTTDAKAKKIIRLEVEKDFTDGHVAMQLLLDNGIKYIDIYGAEGGRIDHQLSNYSLLALAKENGATSIIRTEEFDIHFAHSNFSQRATINKTVSLVPFSDKTHILSTKGLKYSIKNEIYSKLHIKGISNIATENIIGFNIIEGSALIFIEK